MANSALRSRNFVLLVLGQVTSLLGNLSLRFALSMYILEATGSATLFSGLLALSMVPTILLSPFGGMLADRADRRKVMVALDALSGLLVLLAGLALPLGSGIPAIAVLLFALSVLAAFESPTVQACVPQMLAGEALLRGNAIVSQVQAVASLVTPFLGGLFYAAFGLRPVFAAAVLCFLLTALLECFLRLAPPEAAEGPRGLRAIVREDLQASFRFLVREELDILRLLLLAALASLFVTGTAVVGLPYLVRTVLGLSAELYGLAESALGVAAVLGGALVARWPSACARGTWPGCSRGWGSAWRPAAWSSSSRRAPLRAMPCSCSCSAPARSAAASFPRMRSRLSSGARPRR